MHTGGYGSYTSHLHAPPRYVFSLDVITYHSVSNVNVSVSILRLQSIDSANGDGRDRIVVHRISLLLVLLI